MSYEARFETLEVVHTSRSRAKAMKVPAQTRYSSNSACRKTPITDTVYSERLGLSLATVKECHGFRATQFGKIVSKNDFLAQPIP